MTQVAAPPPASPVVAAPSVSSGLKPGYKTTELALVVLTDVGILAGALAGNLSPKWAAIATSVSSGAYALARGLAKLMPPKPSA